MYQIIYSSISISVGCPRIKFSLSYSRSFPSILFSISHGVLFFARFSNFNLTLYSAILALGLRLRLLEPRPPFNPFSLSCASDTIPFFNLPLSCSIFPKSLFFFFNPKPYSNPVKSQHC